MRHVGQRDKLLVQQLLGFGLLGRQLLVFSLPFPILNLLGLGLVAAASLHQGANLLGNAVLLGFHIVGLGLEGAALGVQPYYLGNALLHVLHILDFQSGDDLLGMIFDILQLKHRVK